MLPLDSDEAPEETAVGDDLLVGLVEGGAEVYNILGADLRQAVIEGAGSSKKVGVNIVIRDFVERIQDSVCVHPAIPCAADDLGVRGDLGEFVD